MFIRWIAIFALLFPATALAAPQSAVLHIGNMICGADPHIIKEALMKVSGVQSVEISLEQHTVTVSFDNELASFEKLQAATGAAGYPAN